MTVKTKKPIYIGESMLNNNPTVSDHLGRFRFEFYLAENDEPIVIPAGTEVIKSSGEKFTSFEDFRKNVPFAFFNGVAIPSVEFNLIVDNELKYYIEQAIETADSFDVFLFDLGYCKQQGFYHDHFDFIED